MLLLLLLLLLLLAKCLRENGIAGRKSPCEFTNRIKRNATHIKIYDLIVCVYAYWKWAVNLFGNPSGLKVDQIQFIHFKLTFGVCFLLQFAPSCYRLFSLNFGLFANWKCPKISSIHHTPRKKNRTKKSMKGKANQRRRQKRIHHATVPIPCSMHTKYYAKSRSQRFVIIIITSAKIFKFKHHNACVFNDWGFFTHTFTRKCACVSLSISVCVFVCVRILCEMLSYDLMLFWGNPKIRATTPTKRHCESISSGLSPKNGKCFGILERISC